MLIRRLDEIDREHDGRLLVGVSDDDLYAGVVTVMMRIVFLLFAEERRLLPSDDATYESGYAVGRLVDQLEQRAATHGEQTLEHRTGAWHRLLAVTRALHGGVAHQDLRLPPYGGALFDPDRYPWLEGVEGTPPPVDDLTVLRMLTAVQYVQLGGERRRLTFRALDVEQIGYVYEGLLELEVRSATEPMLLLRRQAGGVDLLTTSAAIEIVGGDVHEWTAGTYLAKKATAATRKRADKLLALEVPPGMAVGLRSTLELAVAEKLLGLASLLRVDERSRPLLVPTGGRYVAASSRRASTGAHYTPRSLAEEVVQHTLEPLAYRPGPLETLDRDTWVLRPSTDLLALKIADIAMGSGAFLVAACRFLADRVVEAWDTEGNSEATRALAHRTVDTADAEVEGVLLSARRLVAEHCLYGVDVNPLAVEMAKLSLWLVTMDRERPFGFLDDRLVCGDTLLGITSLEQLETLHLDPVVGRRLHRNTLDFGLGWRELLARAADARRRITATPVVTVRDVEHKARLLREAQEAAGPLQAVADALSGAGLEAASMSAKQRDAIFRQLYDAVWTYDAGGGLEVLTPLLASVNAGLPEGKEQRRPLHWPLTFPEVFADASEAGFDAVFGNPPFLGGQKLSGSLGPDYLACLQAWDGNGVKGSADLAARFVLRADALLNLRGQLGYVTTNTLVEGDTLGVGLLQLEQRGWTVRRGTSPHAWPSASANLSIIEIWASKAAVKAEAVLDGDAVPRLGVDLQPYLRTKGRPEPLNENMALAFKGVMPLGLGFTMSIEEAEALLHENPANAEALFPYVIGADLNRSPTLSPGRWIVCFQDWSIERAEEFPALLERVRRLVKPKRERAKKSHDYPWWQFLRRRPAMQAALEGLEYVLAMAQTSNSLIPVRLPAVYMFDQKTVVFASQDPGLLAFLSSSVHQTWAIRYSSTMRTDVSYTHTDVFETLPRPAFTQDMTDAGSALDRERRDVMLGRSLGLTKLYNLIHDPAVADPAIVRLREIHVQIDKAVFAAYGWDGFDPESGHHPTKIGIRWTVSPAVRFELLDRLLVENHRRAAVATLQS
ncbi:MAG: Eco57I restriction-modification methylase domain-containing protein [Nocardioidaceae bacterium]